MVLGRLEQAEPPLGPFCWKADGPPMPLLFLVEKVGFVNSIRYYCSVVAVSVPRSWAMFTQTLFLLSFVVIVSLLNLTCLVLLAARSPSTSAAAKTAQVHAYECYGFLIGRSSGTHFYEEFFVPMSRRPDPEFSSFKFARD